MTSMNVFIVNGMSHPLHVAVVHNSPVSIRFVVSPRRVPIPMGDIVRRDDIAPGEAFSATGLPAVTVPLVSRKGFDVEPRLSLRHGKKDDVRVLVFSLQPWKPGEREAAEAKRQEEDANKK